MTLTDIQRECPAPPGWKWEVWSTRGFLCRPQNHGSEWVTIEDLSPGYVDRWSVGAEHGAGAALMRLRCTRADLPSAYLRALTAVGLAEDSEKDALRKEVSDLRRRLTWSEEVPTTPGRYLVEDPDADGAILMYEFGVGGLGWVEYVPHTVRFGPLGFASDSRFLLLANLKET